MVTFPQFANERTFFWYAVIFRLGHRTKQTIVLVWGNGMQQIISSKQRTEQKQTSTYTNHLCKKTTQFKNGLLMRAHERRWSSDSPFGNSNPHYAHVSQVTFDDFTSLMKTLDLGRGHPSEMFFTTRGNARRCVSSLRALTFNDQWSQKIRSWLKKQLPKSNPETS